MLRHKHRTDMSCLLFALRHCRQKLMAGAALADCPDAAPSFWQRLKDCLQMPAVDGIRRGFVQLQICILPLMPRQLPNRFTILTTRQLQFSQRQIPDPQRIIFSSRHRFIALLRRRLFHPLTALPRTRLLHPLTNLRRLGKPQQRALKIPLQEICLADPGTILSVHP